jgi:hypothetical protein
LSWLPEISDHVDTLNRGYWHVSTNLTGCFLALPSAVRQMPGRLRLKCHGTRAENRFLLSARRTSPFKSAGASFQSNTGSRGVCISGSNAGYSMFRGSVKSTGYPLLSLVSPSSPLPCVTVFHHISTGIYNFQRRGTARTVPT